MKIVFLPLDERPCNYISPQELPLSEEISLILPPSNLMSNKKQVCDIDLLHRWLINECKDADYALLSLDTLLYGGIIPSRLHHDDFETLTKRSAILEQIKKNNPHIKIFVNELIMRTPCYSNATEEPDYFDDYGRELWEYGYYLDKEMQNVVTEVEKKKKEELKRLIPNKYLEDLMNRRKINKEVIIHNLQYLLNNTIDDFIIPQDDCAPYGFTSIDRREINEFLMKNKLDKRVQMYPGADEAGLVLISKTLNDYYQKTLKVFVKYTDEKMKEFIPSFEDRPIDITISQHILNARMVRINDARDADLILCVNLYDEKEPEKLTSFIDFMKEQKQAGKNVGIADVLYCNRGDMKLFKKLYEEKMLSTIDAYAGWNTSSNTLGTAIANSVAYYYSKKDKNYSLFARYLEDIFYMNVVREELNEKATNNKLSIENIYPELFEFVQFAKQELEKYIEMYQLKNVYNYQSLDVYFPWRRTFEIGLKIK